MEERIKTFRNQVVEGYKAAGIDIPQDEPFVFNNETYWSRLFDSVSHGGYNYEYLKDVFDSCDRPSLDQINDKLIFGHNALIFALEKIIFSFIDGQCPYSKDLLPEGVKKALVKKKQSSSDEFEAAVYEEVESHSDFCERNICSQPDKNDKCLINIREICPGQLDVLSIHKKNKIIILWDAKHIDEKFGTHEICNKIDTFTKKNKGFIDVNKKKEAFIKRHYKTILDYFKIKDKEGWKVTSCIVLSSDHMVKFILEKKYDIINFFDISEYIAKLEN